MIVRKTTFCARFALFSLQAAGPAVTGNVSKLKKDRGGKYTRNMYHLLLFGFKNSDKIELWGGFKAYIPNCDLINSVQLLGRGFQV